MLLQSPKHYILKTLLESKITFITNTFRAILRWLAVIYPLPLSSLSGQAGLFYLSGRVRTDSRSTSFHWD